MGEALKDYFKKNRCVAVHICTAESPYRDICDCEHYEAAFDCEASICRYYYDEVGEYTNLCTCYKAQKSAEDYYDNY